MEKRQFEFNLEIFVDTAVVLFCFMLPVLFALAVAFALGEWLLIALGWYQGPTGKD
jgi:hypothetical protein